MMIDICLCWYQTTWAKRTNERTIRRRRPKKRDSSRRLVVESNRIKWTVTVTVRFDSVGIGTKTPRDSCSGSLYSNLSRRDAGAGEVFLVWLVCRAVYNTTKPKLQVRYRYQVWMRANECVLCRCVCLWISLGHLYKYTRFCEGI